MFVKKGVKGQVTVFIIIAVLVVAAGVLIYQFYPEIRSSTTGGTESPSSFIRTCLEEEMESVVEKVSLQGGSVSPELYIPYKRNNIEYLCYTNLYYEECIVQQPLLIPHIEKEILSEIEDDVDSCFESLVSSFRSRGYDVSFVEGEEKVELLPKRVVATFSHEFVTTKGDDTAKYETFNIVLDNNLYELASIADSIIGWETTFGKAPTTDYMNWYHDLLVSQEEQIEGTTIYVLTDLNNDKKFQFASRSVVLPPGFG